MSQLTIRGFDAELEQRIRQVAERYSISLNKAALILLKEGSGLNAGTGRVGSSLDHLFGTWSDEDEQEFARAVDDLDEIDEGLWG